ncbi:flavin reductase family protein [Sphingobium sufflavum]|nr:flavin reductase family protein [Sphingobium sufflavum]MCE7798558.1 flavin reductase family protein [Sphingobium sufflavum]
MIDGQTFRRVLGNYPTGVCAITAVAQNGEHVVMVVGTFTSVSLDPPLVGFFPDRKSSSWPKIQGAGKFCVNVLGAAHQSLCRQLATSGPDKFTDVEFRLSGNGSPILASAIAWIDCTLEQVVETGDHYLVLGRVAEMEVVREEDPMLFFRGKYGGFADLETAAP